MRLYFATTVCAWAQVEVSAAAGPEAIMSSGSPRMSERTTWKMRAGAQAAAKRPPLTRERRLRIVFISTMSAPQASSWRVTSASSSPETSGASKRAEPPPESRNTTVSCGDRPLTDEPAAGVAAARAEVDDPVGASDYVDVVLDHYDGVALVAKPQ